MTVVTVDVWDTLLRRRCHPDAVKLATARHLLARLDAQVKERYRDAEALVVARQDVELGIGVAAQGRGLDDEYELREVLERLLLRVTGEPPPAELVAELALFELQFEMDVTYPDPEIAALIQGLDPSRCYFLSDFYMGADALARLLAHHGIDYLDGGYVSCDVGLNKRSGRLFDWFAREHAAELEAHGHRHIGDNEWSDKRVPEARGIASEHYLPPVEHARRGVRERHYGEPEAAAADLRQRLASLGAADEPVARLGATHGALYYGFIEFILHDARARGLETLFFFTREGELFQRLYEVVNASLPDTLRGPPSRLLEVSRVATFFPSLRELGTGELMRVWNLYSRQSMAALCKTLAVEGESLMPFFAAHGIDPDETIVYPWQDPRVTALFADPAFLAELGARRAVAREQVLGYLDQCGCTEGRHRWGIVDIGWRGTIQDNLCYLRPDGHFTGYYLGLQAVLNEQPSNGRKLAFGPDLNRSFDQEGLLNAVAPLEMLCNSPHGSVLGYRRCGERYEAVKKIDPGENAVHEAFTAHYQRGVVAAVTALADWDRESRLLPGVLRRAALDAWQDIIQRPDPALAQAYFSLQHNEEFGMGEVVDKSRPLSYRDLLLAPVLPGSRARVVEHVRNIQWVEGYYQRGDTSLLKRRSLMLLMRGGILYKKVLVRWRVYRRRT